MSKQKIRVSEKELDAEIKQLSSSSTRKPPVVIFQEPLLKTCEELDKSKIIVSPAVESEERKEKVAIFMSGPAGAGKSTMYKKLFIATNIPHTYYNSDLYYEQLLEINHILSYQQEEEYKQQLIGVIRNVFKEMNLLQEKRWGEKLDYYNHFATRNIESIKNTLNNIATKCIKDDFPALLESKHMLVIDRPGDNYESLYHNQYQPLEKNGYTTYMVIVYTSLFEALRNNKMRGKEGRRLSSQVILKVWMNLIKNIEHYQKLFGDRLFILNNLQTRWGDEKGMKYDRRSIRMKLRPYFGTTEAAEKKIDSIAQELMGKKLQEILQRIQFTDINVILEKIKNV